MHWSLDTNITIISSYTSFGHFRRHLFGMPVLIQLIRSSHGSLQNLVKLIKVVDGLHCPTYNRAVWKIFLYFVTLSFKYNHSLYVSFGYLSRAYRFFPHISISVFFPNTEKLQFILSLEVCRMLHPHSKKTSCGAKFPAHLILYIKRKVEKKVFYTVCSMFTAETERRSTQPLCCLGFVFRFCYL